MAGGSNHNTSTAGGNRSRGQEIDIVTQWKQKGMGTLISRFVPQVGRAHRQKKSLTSSTQPTLTSQPFFSVFALFQRPLLSLIQNVQWKQIPALPAYWLGFHRLKGTLYLQSLVCWNPFRRCNSNKIQILNDGEGRRTRGDRTVNKKLSANSEN